MQSIRIERNQVQNQINRELKLSVDLYTNIEKQFEEIRYCVDINTNNFSVHGIRFYELLVNISVAFESTMKIYMIKKGLNHEGAGMKEFKALLLFNKILNNNELSNAKQKEVPDDSEHTRIDQEVKFPTYFGIDIVPFSGLTNVRNSIDWWSAYNDVKHDLSNSLNKANLGNCLKGLSSVYFMLLIAFKYRRVGGHLASPSNRYEMLQSSVFTPFDSNFSKYLDDTFKY